MLALSSGLLLSFLFFLLLIPSLFLISPPNTVLPTHIDLGVLSTLALVKILFYRIVAKGWCSLFIKLHEVPRNGP